MIGNVQDLLIRYVLTATDRGSRVVQTANQRVVRSTAEADAAMRRGAAAEVTAFDRAAAASRRGSEALIAGGRRTREAGHAMSGISTPLLIAAGASVKFAVDFQQSMEMVHTQAGASQREVDRLRGKVLDLAKTLPQSPNELAKGLFHLESVGLRGGKAMDALKIAAQGAAVGNADLEDTATALGSAWLVNIKGAGSLHHVMALLNATVGAGNTRMGDLVQALGVGLLPAAKQAGLSITDTMGAMAVFTDEGYQASSAAAQFSTALHFLYNPTTKAGKAMEAMGLPANQLAKDMHKPQGLLVALRDLHDHLARLPGGASGIQAEQTLGDILPGGRGRILVTLLNQLDRYDMKLKQIQTTSSHFSEAVRKTQETDAFKLHRAWSQIQVDLIDIGSKVAPAVVPALTGVAHVIGTMADGFNALPGPLKTATLLLLGFGAVLGPLLRIGGNLMVAVGWVGKLASSWLLVGRNAAVAAREEAVASRVMITPYAPGGGRGGAPRGLPGTSTVPVGGGAGTVAGGAAAGGLAARLRGFGSAAFGRAGAAGLVYIIAQPIIPSLPPGKGRSMLSGALAPAAAGYVLGGPIGGAIGGAYGVANQTTKLPRGLPHIADFRTSLNPITAFRQEFGFQKPNKELQDFSKHAQQMFNTFRDKGNAVALDRLGDQATHLAHQFPKASSTLRQFATQAHRAAQDTRDNSNAIAQGLVGGLTRARGLTHKNVVAITRELTFMTPQFRQQTATAMLNMTAEMERKGRVARGTTRTLVKYLISQFHDMGVNLDSNTANAIIAVVAGLEHGKGKAGKAAQDVVNAITSKFPGLRHATAAEVTAANARFMRLFVGVLPVITGTMDAIHAILHKKIADIAVDVGSQLSQTFTSPKKAGTSGYTLGSLLSLTQHREGGTMGGLGLVSPGEMLVEPGGMAYRVPGTHTAADNVLAYMEPDTAVLTGHGQMLMAQGATLDQALADQLPHFAKGGRAYPPGWALRGPASVFGPPSEGAGGTAYGRSSADPGLALNPRGGSDWNSRATQSLQGAWFDVSLAGHHGVLQVIDKGPHAHATSGPWSGKWRRFDFTGAGWKAIGGRGGFPTDAIATGVLLAGKNDRRRRPGESAGTRRTTTQPAITKPRLIDIAQPMPNDAFAQGFQSGVEGTPLFTGYAGTDSDLMTQILEGIAATSEDLPHTATQNVPGSRKPISRTRGGRGPGGAYVFPSRSKPSEERVDHGQDMGFGGTTPLLAIGDGKVVSTATGFPGFVMKLDRPFAGHSMVFYGHNSRSRARGGHVHAGQEVATTGGQPGSDPGHTEIGFLQEDGSQYAFNRSDHWTPGGAAMHTLLHMIRPDWISQAGSRSGRRGGLWTGQRFQHGGRKRRSHGDVTATHPKTMSLMQAIWGEAQHYFPGAGPKMPPTRITHGLPDALFVGVSYDPSGSRKGRAVNWPDWFIRDFFSHDPARASANLETLIHEWTHYFQSPALLRSGNTRKIEGGADAYARRHAPAIYRRLRLPYHPAGMGLYGHYVDWVRKNMGAAWIDRGQFVGRFQHGRKRRKPRHRAGPQAGFGVPGHALPVLHQPPPFVGPTGYPGAFSATFESVEGAASTGKGVVPHVADLIRDFAADIDQTVDKALIRQLEQRRGRLRTQLAKLRRGGLHGKEKGQAAAITKALASIQAALTRTHGATFEQLRAMDSALRAEITKLAKGGLTGRERVQVRRLRGLLGAVDAEMGKRLGAVVNASQHLLDTFQRQSSQSQQWMRIFNIDQGSSQGLFATAGQAGAQAAALQGQMAPLQDALRKAQAAKRGDVAKDIQGQLDTVYDAWLQASADAAEAYRQAVEKQASEQVDTADFGLQITQQGLTGLELQQKLAKTYDTAAGGQQRAKYIREQIEPQLRNELAAVQAAAAAAQSVGDTPTWRENMLKAADLQNQLLQSDVDANEQTADNTDALRDMQGSLAFSYQGELQTDLLAANVGAG